MRNNLQNKFSICDKCLAYDHVFVPDCGCGRCICKGCFEQEIFPDCSKISSDPSIYKEFFDDSQTYTKELCCIRCQSKENICWHCQQQCGDNEKKCSAQGCNMRYHKVCWSKLEGLRPWSFQCPLHICQLCQKTIYDHKDSYSCYVCLFSYHDKCLRNEQSKQTSRNTIILDQLSDQLLTPIICSNCSSQFQLQGLPKAQQIEKYLKYKEKLQQPLFSTHMMLNYNTFKQNIYQLYNFLSQRDVMEQVKRLKNDVALETGLTSALTTLHLDTRCFTKIGLLNQYLTQKQLFYSNYQSFQKDLASIIDSFIDLAQNPDVQLNSENIVAPLQAALAKSRNASNLSSKQVPNAFNNLFKTQTKGFSQEDQRIAQEALAALREGMKEIKTHKIEDRTRLKFTISPILAHFEVIWQTK